LKSPFWTNTENSQGARASHARGFEGTTSTNAQPPPTLASILQSLATAEFAKSSPKGNAEILPPRRCALHGVRYCETNPECYPYFEHDTLAWIIESKRYVEGGSLPELADRYEGGVSSGTSSLIVAPFGPVADAVIRASSWPTRLLITLKPRLTRGWSRSKSFGSPTP